MADSPSTQAETPDGLPPDWATASSRVAWLVESRFKGNRSAFASAIGFSHTAINKVVTGERKPGHKLLAAVTRNLGVNADWLLNGGGRPFGDASELARGGLPSSRVPLPGPPLDNQGLLCDERVDFGQDLFAPSRYWLILTSSQPILRAAGRGFRSGDWLLVETDRAKFPAEQKLFRHLCVVRIDGGEGAVKLASVTHCEGQVEDGPAYLEADTFDARPAPEEVVREVVYRHFPGGEIKHAERLLRPQLAHGQERLYPVDEGSEPLLPRIIYTDILAVWANIIYRAGGM